jgi:hypothetical protein
VLALECWRLMLALDADVLPRLALRTARVECRREA